MANNRMKRLVLLPGPPQSLPSSAARADGFFSLLDVPNLPLFSVIAYSRNVKVLKILDTHPLSSGLTQSERVSLAERIVARIMKQNAAKFDNPSFVAELIQEYLSEKGSTGDSNGK
ncbi:hypothetical protein HZC07_01250 [Candidatus Micrarchaeota archaeon]|nr:hypothetical protein [Candidatus Micrarchaeota archaeon]